MVVARLRRLAVVLRDGDGDAQWLARGLCEYLDGAERGLSLDLALDLSPAPGQANWWTAEGIEARDAALREMAARFWPERKVASQAYEIHRAALRYAASSWRFDHERADMPGHYRGNKSEYLWLAFASGATMPLSKRQLQTILAAAQQSDAA